VRICDAALAPDEFLFSPKEKDEGRDTLAVARRKAEESNASRMRQPPDGSFSIAPVPEPGMLALPAAGGAVLLLGWRKKKGLRKSIVFISPAIILNLVGVRASPGAKATRACLA